MIMELYKRLDRKDGESDVELRKRIQKEIKENLFYFLQQQHTPEEKNIKKRIKRFVNKKIKERGIIND